MAGGYQRPSNPAPVSGPGALSARTDGGPGAKQAVRDISGGAYGDNTEMRAMQQGAPMARTDNTAPPVHQQVLDARNATAAPTEVPTVPFNAPSERPDESMTSGSPFGDGYTPPPPPTTDEQVAANFRRFENYLPSMRWAAAQPDASPLLRSYVRWIDAIVSQ